MGVDVAEDLRDPEDLPRQQLKRLAEEAPGGELQQTLVEAHRALGSGAVVHLEKMVAAFDIACPRRRLWPIRGSS